MLRLAGLFAGIAMTIPVLCTGCHSTPESAVGTAGWQSKSVAEESEIAGPVDLELSLARTLERDGDLARAAGAYRQILNRNPDQPAALHRLAVVHDRSQRFEESAPLYRQAIELRPDDPELLCDYAFSLYQQNELVEAESLLRRAVEVSPGHQRSHNHLGLILARTDRRDEAFHEFHAAGCTAPQAHENIGLVLSIDGRLEEARSAYVAALAAGPDSATAQERLAEVDSLIVSTGTGDTAVQTAGHSTPTPLDHNPDDTGRATLQLTGGETFTPPVP